METLALFYKIVKKFRKLDIDIFAGRINKQLDRYIPRTRCNGYQFHCFTWNNNNLHIFTPFSLAGWVLTKIHRDKINAVILVDWSTQYWYPHLVQMTNQDTSFFRPSPKNLTFDKNSTKFGKKFATQALGEPSNIQKIQLIAVRVIILQKKI